MAVIWHQYEPLTPRTFWDAALWNLSFWHQKYCPGMHGIAWCLPCITVQNAMEMFTLCLTLGCLRLQIAVSQKVLGVRGSYWCQMPPLEILFYEVSMRGVNLEKGSVPNKNHSHSRIAYSKSVRRPKSWIARAADESWAHISESGWVSEWCSWLCQFQLLIDRHSRVHGNNYTVTPFSFKSSSLVEQQKLEFQFLNWNSNF